MTYDQKIDAKTITSYYLFGQTTAPSAAELLDDRWISRGEPEGLIFSNSEFHQYMTTGPGRFANASQISLIENFFTADITPDLLGKKFTLSQALEVFGGSHQQDLLQSDYKDAGGQEWAERVYLFETQTYALNQNIEFYINGDGVKSIKNFVIMLQDEDFDFDGGFWSNLGNMFIEPDVDPSSIGKTIDITYPHSADSEYHLQYGTTYTIDDYYGDITRYSEQNHGTLAEVYFPMMDLMKELWNSGITQFIDPQGRAIVYGTNGDDSFSLLGSGPNGTHNFQEGSFMREYYSTHFQNGIAMISGNGNDTLKGGDYNDWLEGGEGADTLQGGKGYDTYITDDGDTIKDDDGEGMVFVGEKFLTGGTKVCTDGSNADDAGVYMGNGGIYVWSEDHTLTFTNSEGTVTIKDWDNGELGTIKQNLSSSSLFLVKSNIKNREPDAFLICISQQKQRGLRNSLCSDSPRPSSPLFTIKAGNTNAHTLKAV